MLGSKMSYIIKNKRYKKGRIYLAVILFIVICIMAYIKVEAFIEEQNHEKWVKQKEQEFKPVIDLAYSVMKGEKKFRKRVRFLSMTYHIMQIIKMPVESRQILK